ncbi:hypothetical protein FACS1894201_01940 [Bacteroidia bacterium]|nr:hypothetical protein FACS1894201_01940 [Bacteroidia bacterium]
MAVTVISAQNEKVALANDPAAQVKTDVAPTIEGPEAQFNEMVHDYGTIAYKGDGSCVFTFTNVGTEPLVIHNVQSSCGCTVPEFSREPVMPGETGNISVKYDTTRPGSISKQITVYSNGHSDRIVLRITGNVLSEAVQTTTVNP